MLKETASKYLFVTLKMFLYYSNLKKSITKYCNDIVLILKNTNNGRDIGIKNNWLLKILCIKM